MKNHINKISAVFFLSFLSFGMFGQGWLRIYEKENIQGFPFSSSAQTVVPTLDGGSMLATFEVSEFRDSTWIHLLKTDEDGNIVFQKNIKDYGKQVSFSDIKAKQGGGFWLTGTISFTPDSTHVYLMNIDEMGEVVQFTEYPSEDKDKAAAVSLLPTGGEVIVGSSVLDGDTTGVIIYKLNELGELIWRKEYGLGQYLYDGHDIHVDSNGDLIVVGRCGFIDLVNGWMATMYVFKTNNNGDLLWSESFLLSNDGGAYTITESPDGGYVIGGGNGSPVALKIDSEGNQHWITILDDGPGYGVVFDIMPASNGGYFMTGFSKGYLSPDLILAHVDESGQIIWKNTLPKPIVWSGTSLYQRPDGCLVVCGNIGTFWYNRDLFLMKTDSLGNAFSSAITGSLLIDNNQDCIVDSLLEKELAGWVVQAIGNSTFTALTDSLGQFLITVDTGAFDIIVSPPSPYWDICNNPTTVNVTSFYDTTLLDFPAQVDEECPYLEASLTTPFLRRCFDNTYTVQYCNYGTVPAEDAYVEVTLDDYLTYQSSTIPFVNQNGNTLTFDLGDVAVNDCGSFQVTAFLDCDSTILGQTHCSEAHIFPDSLCIPTSPLWDGSNIEVDVECVSDSVIFNIQNTGNGDMTLPLNYIIIEDQIVLFDGTFQLDVGETMTIPIFGNGSTFHLEVEQSPDHPSGNLSTGATIEGCNSWFSLGFFTQYANPDDSPFIDIDCQENVGSYDPNDKQAFPVGFGEEHLIEPQTDLEYLIRFQNTGTDTAFKIVVVDILPKELDLATLRPGASSHPYGYTVSPEGWPIFTFNDIMLPDSSENEAASHGFVKFKISQKEGNGHGTYIRNDALIYFDFNSPIQTNTVLHKVGQIFPWTVVGVDLVEPSAPTLRVAPNPLAESASLFFENMEPGMLRLLLVSPAGQVVREEKRFGVGFEFQRADLPPGIYFFKIEKDGNWISSGKLIIQ